MPVVELNQMLDLSQPFLCTGPKLGNSVAGEPVFSPHPSEKAAPAHTQTAEEIPIVRLRQAKLLGPFYAHIQSKARDALQMNSFRQLK